MLKKSYSVIKNVNSNFNLLVLTLVVSVVLLKKCQHPWQVRTYHTCFVRRMSPVQFPNGTKKIMWLNFYGAHSGRMLEHLPIVSDERYTSLLNKHGRLNTSWSKTLVPKQKTANNPPCTVFRKVSICLKSCTTPGPTTPWP